MKAYLSLGAGAKGHSTIQGPSSRARVYSVKVGKHVTIHWVTTMQGFLEVSLGNVGGIHIKHVPCIHTSVVLRLFAQDCREWTLHSPLRGPRCRTPSCEMKEGQAPREAQIR